MVMPSSLDDRHIRVVMPKRLMRVEMVMGRRSREVHHHRNKKKC